MLLQQDVQHYQCYSGVRSLPNILANHGYMSTLIGKYHVAPIVS